MTNDLPSSSLPPEPLPETPVAARLTNVFVSPGEVFAELKTRPVRHANWLVPALVFVIAGWIAGVLTFYSEPIQNQIWEIQQQALAKQQSQNLSPAQMDQMRAVMKVAQAVGYFFTPVLQAAVKCFGGGFLLWLGALLLLRQRRLEYLKAVEIAGLALMIGAVGELIRGLLCAAQGTMFTRPGPVLLIGDFQQANLWHAAALAVDVFVLWMLFVRAIGLAKLCEVSLVKALAWVFSVWALWSSGTVMLSWASQKFAATMTGQH